MSNQKQKHKDINKLVGILESGEILYIDSFHSNGVCTTSFDYLTQEMVDDRNDIEELKSTYDYLWQEAVADGSTELGLEEYLEALVESETSRGGKYFFGQDDSYTYHITSEDKELIDAYYTEASGLESEIECFDCVGGGTGCMSDLKFQKVFNQELLDQAIEHEASIDKQKPKKRPALRLV